MYLGGVAYILKQDHVMSVQEDCPVVFIVVEQVLSQVHGQKRACGGIPE